MSNTKRILLALALLMPFVALFAHADPITVEEKDGINPGDLKSATTGDISDGTATTIIAAASGIRHVVYGVTVTNSHATVAARVDILDGSTVRASCAVTAAGGHCVIPWTLPTSKNTDFKCQSSASATIRCTADYYDTSN